MIIVAMGLMCLVALSLMAEPLQSLQGKLSLLKEGKELRMQSSDGKSYRLLLAPQAALDSLGISPAMLSGDAHIKGTISGAAFITYQITIGDSVYVLRDARGTPLWSQTATMNVSASKCIGCRMCPSQCPVNAIKMVKGKAIIDPALCTECGICADGLERWRGCPVGAITK